MARVPGFSRFGDRRLPRFARARQGWRKLQPGVTRPPVPWTMVALIASQMTAAGCAVAALAVVTLFFLYLGPGGLLKLRGEGLIAPAGTSRFWVVNHNLHPSERGESSKVGLSDESIALDSVEVPWLGTALARIKLACDTALLFPLSYNELKHAWDVAQDKLGAPVRYVLYQCRHGGPSHDRLLKRRSVAEVKRRGRWSSDATMRRYEAHARVQQEEARMGKRLVKRGQAAAGRLHKDVLDGLRQQNARASRSKGSSSSSSAVWPISAKHSQPPAVRVRAGTSTTAPSRTSPTRTWSRTLGL